MGPTSDRRRLPKSRLYRGEECRRLSLSRQERHTATERPPLYPNQSPSKVDAGGRIEKERFAVSAVLNLHKFPPGHSI